MKILHIKAKSKVSIEQVLKKVKLEGKIGLVTTIQFLDQLEKARKLIKNSIIIGQILGCTKFKKINVSKFLYIGSGKFHPIRLALQTNKEVYIANPLTNEFSKITKEEINNLKNKIKGKYSKFLNAEKIGILVSIKFGQYNLEKAIKFKNKLKKESYIFLFNILREEELENFQDIEYWVNTACPRIEGKNIINQEDIESLLWINQKK